MRVGRAIIIGMLLGLSAPAAAQSESTARAAFLDASQAGDLPRMKRLMAPMVVTMNQQTISADRFLELIDGCPQSFVGKAMISWKCTGDRPRVVTVILTDGPIRVSLGGLSVIAIYPAPEAGGRGG